MITDLRKLFLILVSLLSFNSSFGQKIEKTELLSKPINLNLENKTTREVLREIEDQHGLVFVYNSDLVSDDKVNLKKKNYSLKELIDELLFNEGLDYIISENLIILKEKPGVIPSAKRKKPIEDPIKITPDTSLHKRNNVFEPTFQEIVTGIQYVSIRENEGILSQSIPSIPDTHEDVIHNLKESTGIFRHFRVSPYVGYSFFKEDNELNLLSNQVNDDFYNGMNLKYKDSYQLGLLLGTYNTNFSINSGVEYNSYNKVLEYDYLKEFVIQDYDTSIVEKLVIKDSTVIINGVTTVYYDSSYVKTVKIIDKSERSYSEAKNAIPIQYKTIVIPFYLGYLFRLSENLSLNTMLGIRIVYSDNPSTENVSGRFDIPDDFCIVQKSQRIDYSFRAHFNHRISRTVCYTIGAVFSQNLSKTIYQDTEMFTRSKLTQAGISIGLTFNF